MQVDLRARRITRHGTGWRIGNLDGIEKFRGRLLVTDFIGGRLLAVAEDGSQSTLADGFQTSADLGVDKKRRTVAIPVMFGGVVLLLDVPNGWGRRE